MLVLKLPPFFPHLDGKGKRAAISKLAYFSQKRIRSFIILGLDEFQNHILFSKEITIRIRLGPAVT